MTVSEYAKRKKITRQAVLYQIKNNLLPTDYSAKKIGNNWIIFTQMAL